MAERTAGVAQLRIDAWVLPSHAQAARVAEGALDLAICWVQRSDLDEYGLDAHLVGADPLYAVGPGRKAESVQAKDVVVLFDSDTDSWSSWNRFGAQFAADTRARAVCVDEGGVAGAAFVAHIRRLRCPVLNSPKDQNGQLPADLVRRPDRQSPAVLDLVAGVGATSTDRVSGPSSRRSPTASVM